MNIINIMYSIYKQLVVYIVDIHAVFYVFHLYARTCMQVYIYMYTFIMLYMYIVGTNIS